MMRTTRAVLVVLITATALVGCGQGSPSASLGEASGTKTTTIALRTQEPQPAGTAQACMAALIEGVLVRDVQSGVALQDPQGLVRQVIWPNGYSAREDSGPLIVLDASGNLVAHEGDRVSIGGGEIDAKGTWLGCGGTTILAP
jgi:hypothetical protein